MKHRKESTHFNVLPPIAKQLAFMVWRQPVRLSLAYVCIGRVRKCRNVRVTVYKFKSGLARCGDNLYKPSSTFAWYSFLFIHCIISIRVTGSKFVPG